MLFSSSHPCALLCKVYMFESVVNWLCISSFTLVVFCHRCFTLSSASLVLLSMICFCCVSHLLFQASVPLVFIVSVSPCLCRVVPHCCVYPSVVIPHSSWILFFVFRLCFFLTAPALNAYVKFHLCSAFGSNNNHHTPHSLLWQPVMDLTGEHPYKKWNTGDRSYYHSDNSSVKVTDFARCCWNFFSISYICEAV